MLDIKDSMLKKNCFLKGGKTQTFWNIYASTQTCMLIRAHIQLHIHRLHIKTLEDQFTNSNQDTSFATQMKSLAKSMAQSLQDWLVIVECMRFWPETFTMCNLFPFSTYDGFPAD